jgi:hypothetical protein
MKPQRSKIRFCERSIDSAYNVFVNNLIRDNLLTDLESYWITEFYRWLKTIIPKPDGIIYVDVILMYHLKELIKEVVWKKQVYH